ncbi:hypothetical protein D3C76_323860 [compost metagenome]
MYHTGTHLAVRALDGNGSARLTATGKHGARAIDGDVGGGCRWLQVCGGVACAAGHIACSVSLAHAQYLAVELRGVQVDGEHATAIHHRRAEHVVAGITHCHRGTGFTRAGQHQAIDRQAGDHRVGRWRDVGRLQEGRLRFAAYQRHRCHRNVFAIELSCVQRQGEGAVQACDPCTDQVACSVVHANAHTAGCTACQGQAVAAQGHVGGRHGWCDQGCEVGRDRRRIDAVGLCHFQGCERARRRHQRYLEVASGIHHAGTDHVSVEADGDRGIGFALAGQHVEGVVDRQVGHQVGWRGVVGLVRDSHRSVAGIIGGHHRQQLAVVLCRADRHSELAVLTHFHRAHDVVVRAAHRDRAAGFGRTRHRRTGCVEQQVGRLHRWRQVWRSHCQRYRRVASGVLGDDGQRFAVDLRAVQVKDEGAVRLHRYLAQQVAVVVDHRDAGAGFGSTGHLGTAVVDGGDHGGRWCGVHRRDRTDWRDVAGCIGQGDLQHLAIELRCIQPDDEGPVGAYCAGTDLRGTDVHAHGGAHFADTAQLVTCRIEPQLGCCRWRREVRRLHVDRQADVAGWIGLQYRQCLVVDLCG